MPSPQSGNAGTAVSPAAPDDAKDACDSTPGQVEQASANPIQKKSSDYKKYGVKPYKPDKDKNSWIEIEMVDEDNKPVAGMEYEITLPDGESVAAGTLDDKGLARIEGIDSGNCKITFPSLDKDAWEPA